MKKTAAMVLVLLTAGLSSAATLEVSISPIRLAAAVVGTEFDVPIMVRIPDGAAGQGLARLYIRIVSADSVNVIAPVISEGKIATTYADCVRNFGARINSFIRDLDGDGDLDAGDTGLADLGLCPNNSIGIGSGVVVMVQRWKFTAAPEAGKSYPLAVQFSLAKSYHYSNSKEITFATQSVINGSITVSSTMDDVAAVQAALDSPENDLGNYNPFCDFDGDGEITSTDLALVLQYLPPQ